MQGPGLIPCGSGRSPGQLPLGLKTSPVYIQYPPTPPTPWPLCPSRRMCPRPLWLGQQGAPQKLLSVRVPASASLSALGRAGPGPPKAGMTPEARGLRPGGKRSVWSTGQQLPFSPRPEGAWVSPSASH